MKSYLLHPNGWILSVESSVELKHYNNITVIYPWGVFILHEVELNIKSLCESRCFFTVATYWTLKLCHKMSHIFGALPYFVFWSFWLRFWQRNRMNEVWRWVRMKLGYDDREISAAHVHLNSELAGTTRSVRYIH